jgi:hypothetical protein
VLFWQVSARSFLYPVHVSLSFLFTPTLGAALYLVLVRDASVAVRCLANRLLHPLFCDVMSHVGCGLVFCLPHLCESLCVVPATSCLSRVLLRRFLFFDRPSHFAVVHPPHRALQHRSASR